MAEAKDKKQVGRSGNAGRRNPQKDYFESIPDAHSALAKHSLGGGKWMPRKKPRTEVLGETFQGYSGMVYSRLGCRVLSSRCFMRIAFVSSTFRASDSCPFNI